MANKSTDDAARALADANVRVERIIWIPGIGADALSDDFKDFCESALDSDRLHRTLNALPAVKKWNACAEHDPDAVAEGLAEDLASARSAGFFIQGATPMRNYTSKNAQSYTFSWGAYHTCWLYAATVTAIKDVLLTWAADMAAKDHAGTTSSVAEWPKMHRLTDDDSGVSIVCAGHVDPFEFADRIDCDDVATLLGGEYAEKRDGYPLKREIKRLAKHVLHTYGKWNGKRLRRWDEVHKDDPGAQPFTFVSES